MPRDDPPQSGMSARRQFEAAMSLHRQGKLGDAELHYRSILGLHADHLGTLHGLALLLAQTGRFAEAAETYKAEDTQNGRMVMLKSPNPLLLGDPHRQGPRTRAAGSR